MGFLSKEIPFLAKKAQHNFTPKHLLKRSLSHSARVLTSKANQIKSEPKALLDFSNLSPRKDINRAGIAEEKPPTLIKVAFEGFHQKQRSPNVKVVSLDI